MITASCKVPLLWPFTKNSGAFIGTLLVAVDGVPDPGGVNPVTLMTNELARLGIGSLGLNGRIRRNYPRNLQLLLITSRTGGCVPFEIHGRLPRSSWPQSSAPECVAHVRQRPATHPPNPVQTHKKHPTINRLDAK